MAQPNSPRNLGSLFRQIRALFLYVFKLFMASFSFMDLDLAVDCKTMHDVHRITNDYYARPKDTLVRIIEQNRRFLAPFLLSTIAHWNNFIVLSNANFQFDFYGLPGSFAHRVFPKDLWFESDITTNIGITLATTNLFLLLTKPQIDPNYRIYVVHENPPKVVSHGNVWKEKFADKFHHIRTKGRIMIQMAMIMGYIQTAAFWEANAFMQTNFDDPMDLFFLWYIPIVALYAVYGKN